MLANKLQSHDVHAGVPPHCKTLRKSLTTRTSHHAQAVRTYKLSALRGPSDTTSRCPRRSQITCASFHAQAIKIIMLSSACVQLTQAGLLCRSHCIRQTHRRKKRAAERLPAIWTSRATLSKPLLQTDAVKGVPARRDLYQARTAATVAFVAVRTIDAPSIELL